MTLGDFDVPTFYEKRQKRHIYAAPLAYVLSFFMAMTLLPATIQDTAVELAVAAALNGAALGFYSWGTSPSGGLSALGVFLAIFFLFGLKEGGAALMRYRARKAREITENENLFYEVSKEEAGTLRVDALIREPSARRQEGKEDEAWDDARQLYESTPDLLHKMKPQAAEARLGGLASKYAVADASTMPSSSPPLGGGGGRRVLAGLNVDPGAALYDGAHARESPLGAAVGGGGSLPRKQPAPPPPGRPPEPEELPYWSGALIYDGLKTDDFFNKPSFETNRPMEKISGPPIASSNNKVYGPGVTASKGGGDVDMDTAAQAAARLGASPSKHLALADLFPVLSNVFPALETSRSRHDDDEAFGRGQGFGLGRREPSQPHPGAVEREADHRQRRSRHRSVERERRVRDDGGGGGGEDGGLSRSGGLNNASAVVGDGRSRRLAPLEGRAPGQGLEGDPDVQPSNDDDGDRGGRRRSGRDRHRSHRSGRDRSSRSRDRRSSNNNFVEGGGGEGQPSEEAEAAERRRRRKTRSSRGRGGDDYSGPGAQSASSRSEIPITDSAVRLMAMRSDSALPTVNVLDGIDEHSTSGGGGGGGGDGDFPMILND
jgi:hypothetical protein